MLKYLFFLDNGSLNRNVCLRPICFNSWFPVDGIAWEGLGGITLLEVAGHRRWSLSFQKLTSLQVSSLCLVVVSQDLSSQLRI